jgi:hypothetical protein
MRILLKVLIRWWWKMAEMSQRWDLNPGLSRKVRGLRWEFISLKLFFFFVETFFKKKKERKKVFKKKKKSFEIRWWWKMGRDEPEVRLESRVEQKSQRAEMRIHIFETFFFLLKLFSKKKKRKEKKFSKKKKVSRSGDDEKWAEMSQRWDLNPGLSRKVRGLRWEFISLKLFFFFVETFFKKKKERKKVFKKKKKVSRSGDDEKWAGMSQRWDLNPGLSRKVRGLRWEFISLKLFFFFVETFFKKKKERKKVFKKKKKSFEIRWWWKMGRDEPEVRLESRVEQKSQRAEMRIHIFETFFFLLKLFSKKKKRKEKKFSKKKKSFEIRWWWKMGRDEPEVRLESRVEQKSQRVEMRIHIFETFFFFVETFFKKKKKRKKVFKKKKSFEIRWWWKMGRDEPEVRFESRVEQEKSEGWDFQSCGDEKWQGWAREAGAEI